jgi:hypothetical protein
MSDPKLSPFRIIAIDARTGGVRCGLCRDGEDNYAVLEQAERWAVIHFAAWHPQQLPLLRRALTPSKLCEDGYFVGMMQRMMESSPSGQVPTDAAAMYDHAVAAPAEGFGLAPSAPPTMPSIERVREACRQLGQASSSEVFVASLKDLAALTKLSIPTVMKWRKRLIEDGWLVEVGGGSYGINGQRNS